METLKCCIEEIINHLVRSMECLLLFYMFQNIRVNPDKPHMSRNCYITSIY